MGFIRWLINTYYKDELQEIVDEHTIKAKDVLNEANTILADTKSKVYIYYERADIGSDEFLHGMQPIFRNKYFISWLNEQKAQWQRLIKRSVDEGNKENAHLFSVKMSLIDDLFMDLRDFETKYEEMLNQKKEEQIAGTGQR